MPRLRTLSEHRSCRMGCPVYGGSVVVTATYHHETSGRTQMVSFECNRDGMCGISSWDPCPLYVQWSHAHPSVHVAETELFNGD